jgi:hypothetical protein
MRCKDVEPLIYLVREGEITAEEERQLVRHLAICKNCKQIYESVVVMTKLVKQSIDTAEVSENKHLNAGTIIRSADKKNRNQIPELVRDRYLSFIKGIAASLLVIIASTLLYQEADFYQRKSALKIPLQQTEGFSAFDSEEVDCVNELKRRYKVRTMTFVPQDENLGMNRISEKQLTQYIQQVCGSDAGDINKVKNLLMQAGLIKKNHVN